MKKYVSAILVFLFCFTALPLVAVADNVGDKRIVLGADLTADQKDLILGYFNVDDSNLIKELIVTNSDEKTYLKDLVPQEKIGNKALSSIYIEIAEKGSGLSIQTNNINWCTPDMYKNALTTAGIVDAKVMVAAPFPVSGTAALTGAYKAYEDITGVTLTELAKTAGIQELIVTGDLAEYVGSEDATVLINELKKILDQTQNMTDEEVLKEIRSIAKAYNIALTETQEKQVLSLCRSLEKLDVKALQDRIKGLANTLETAQKAQETVSNFTKGIKDFFASVGNFFSNLFTKK